MKIAHRGNEQKSRKAHKAPIKHVAARNPMSLWTIHSDTIGINDVSSNTHRLQAARLWSCDHAHSAREILFLRD